MTEPSLLSFRQMGGTEHNGIHRTQKSYRGVKGYGKDAISSGKKKLDTVDDLVEIVKLLYEIPAGDVVERNNPTAEEGGR